MSFAIRVENLSKSYRISHQSSGRAPYRTLREDLVGWLRAPFAALGRQPQVASEVFWALNDVSFEVPQGSVVGIIGRNGAGKSTLLKILSRITEPTSGRIRLRGRVGSLLEVGTGFHPELTGRENIFLSGAVLGMTRAEVIRKLDEIVGFAEVERFLDTPVKRYSSGMSMRLAFAVAAHLEPDILVIDEVLAVGDAAFQKKCLGRMKDISRQNRTVLFVSHNTHAVLGLCDTVVWLESGRIKLQGGPREIVSTYLSDRSSEEWSKTWEGDAKAPGNAKVTLRNVSLEPDFREGEGKISLETSLQFTFDVINHVPGAQLHLSVHLVEVEKGCILCTTSAPRCHEAGVIRSGFRLPGGLVNDGTFFLRVIVVEDGVNPILVVNEALFFTIHDTERTSGWYGKWEGAVRPRLNWTVENAQAI